MTPDEIRAVVVTAPDLRAAADGGNWSEIAAAIADTPGASISVEDVFDALFLSGDYAAIKAAQLAGTASAVMAFSTLVDAKTLGPGMVNLDTAATRALFDALESDGLLTSAGRAALDARRPLSVVTPAQVELALKHDDGSMRTLS